MSGEQRYSNAFDAIYYDDPAETLNLKLRSTLMMTITEEITRREWTQKQAAKFLSVTQPRISDLQRGKISLFSLDALVCMAGLLGCEIEMTVKVA